MPEERIQSRSTAARTPTHAPPWYGRSLLLLAAQILLLLLMPILSTFGDEGFVFSALSTIVVLAAVYGLGSRRRVLIAGAILAVPTLFETWTGAFGDWRYDAISGLAGLAFYIFAIITILTYVLRSGPVTLDRLYAAVSVYLLIGMTFAIAYMLLHRVSPPAFASSTIDPIENQAIIYFSYVTLTTLGYGDMTPVLPLVRSLAVLEAIIGVLFIAVFVARLVAALPGHAAPHDETPASSGP